MEKAERDNIFALRTERVGDFRFDAEVARVFPDMINRSVPGYGSILSMIGQLAEKFAEADSNVYDLGCSLGAATRLIRSRIPSTCKLYAVDKSAAMVARLREILDGEKPPLGQCEVIVQENDLAGYPMSNASFCVLNFTLQFIPLDRREELLRRICEALRPGGALLLSEKICVEEPRAQALLIELHEQFKRANGYSELEIAQKRSALERTLIPETVQAHLARLEAVGFGLSVPWFQCFNFVSLLAIK